MDYSRLFNEKKIYTTKDIEFGTAYIMLKQYGILGKLTAVIKHGDKIFECSRHAARSTYKERYKPLFYGYEYNLLGAFNDFLCSLDSDSYFINVRHLSTDSPYTVPDSQENAKELLHAMNLAIPGWKGEYAKEQNNFVDFKKRELMDDINATLSRKNIHLDLSEWFNEIVSKTVTNEYIKEKRVRNSNLDYVVYKVKRTDYHVVYADGFEDDTWSEFS